MDDRGNGYPGNSTFLSGGDVAAFVVGDVLVVVAADQVSSGSAIGGGFGLWAASRA